MLLFPGDRLVLRRPSPVNTFAGGKVLDAGLRRWRRRDSAELDRLPDVRPDAWPQLLASWIEREGLSGLPLPAISGRLGVFDSSVEAPIGRLLEGGVVKALATQPPTFVASSALDDLARDAVAELKRRLAGQEVSAGIPARDFAGKLLPRRALPLADVYLEELRGRGVLDLSEGRVVPPGSDDHMTSAGRELTAKVEALYREDGFDASSPADAARRLEVKPAAVEGICKYLLQRRRLVRLEGKYLIHRTVLDEMAQRVRDWEVDDFGIGDFKERFGLTRKLAIPRSSGSIPNE